MAPGSENDIATVNAGVPPASTGPRVSYLVLLCALTLLLQWPLILNPGYFSHDELQWAYAAFARPFSDIGWFSPLAIDVFQYRPLTFNLWLLLSHFFFDQPLIMHLAQALLASANAVLMDRLLARLGVRMRWRWLSIAVWLWFPYVAYTHGWIGTLGDQIWLGASLFALLACHRSSASGDRVIESVCIGGFATAFALMAKEAALVMPALMLAQALAWPAARRSSAVAAAASAVVVLIYLVLRWPALQAGAADSSYHLVFTAIPARIAEYWLYPATLQRFEPFNTLDESSKRLLWSGATLLLLCCAIGWRSWRGLLAFLLLPTLALGPTLILGFAAAQYAYGFAAALIVLLAVIVQGRPVLGLAALPWLLLCLSHGISNVYHLRETGRVQARLLADVNAWVRAHPRGELRVRALRASDQWRVERSLNFVPGYLGIPWQGRVLANEPGDATQPTHLMHRDGSLQVIPAAAD